MDLENKINEIHETVIQLRIDVATLKIKAGIWGLLGGLIPVSVTIALIVIKAL